MLQELLSDLAAQGGHYEVAVQVTQYAFPPTPGLIPPSNYICVSVNDYNVISGSHGPAFLDLPVGVTRNPDNS